MNNKREEKKYFYGIVRSPMSYDAMRKFLGLTENSSTGTRMWGPELHYSYIDYEYSTEYYGLFGLLSREVKKEVVKNGTFSIIVEKKENYYVDIISGEIYKSPALPGQIDIEVRSEVNLVWLANYLKRMTKEKIDIYINTINELKRAIADEYYRKRNEEIKSQNEYNEAEKYVNEFIKKYKR